MVTRSECDVDVGARVNSPDRLNSSRIAFPNRWVSPSSPPVHTSTGTATVGRVVVGGGAAEHPTQTANNISPRTILMRNIVALNGNVRNGWKADIMPLRLSRPSKA